MIGERREPSESTDESDAMDKRKCIHWVIVIMIIILVLDFNCNGLGITLSKTSTSSMAHALDGYSVSEMQGTAQSALQARNRAINLKSTRTYEYIYIYMNERAGERACLRSHLLYRSHEGQGAGRLLLM